MSCWKVGDSLGEDVGGGGKELTQKRQGCRMPVKVRPEVQLAYWKANMAVAAAAQYTNGESDLSLWGQQQQEEWIWHRDDLGCED